MAARREEAARELDQAQQAVDQAEALARAIPPAEELRRAQGDLTYLNALEADLRLAKKAIPAAQARWETAQAAVDADPYFAGQESVQAAAKAQADRDEVLRLRRPDKKAAAILGAAALALALTLLRLYQKGSAIHQILLPGGCGLLLLALLAAVLFWMGRRRKKQADELLERYGVPAPEDILDRAADYNRKCAEAQEAQRELRAVQAEADKLEAQREELTAQLLAFVRPFEPTARDLIGVSAALSLSLQRGERLRLAQARLEAARRVLTALPVPEPGGAGDLAAPAGEPEGDRDQIAAQLAAVSSELRRASDVCARLEGELARLGDPTDLSARESALGEELERRQGELDALTAALEGLKAADGLLRERFSPAVNAKAGQYLSELTGGRYTAAALTRDFQAAAREEGEPLSRDHLLLSGGTAQQLYLAVRLAMCELALPKAERCPIVLDDVLDAFDDERAQLAVGCLEAVAEERQVLLFTCHGRDAALLRRGERICLG